MLRDPEAPIGSPSIAQDSREPWVRYDAPDVALGEAITGYHIYTAASPNERVDWFLPAGADICITLDAGPIGLTVRRRSYDPMPDAALIGPTSQAFRAVTHGGTLIGIGLTALGWSRLFRTPASDCRDRVIPLGDALSPAFADDLRTVLSATDRNAGVKPALDAFFTSHLGPPHPDAPQIRKLMALLVDERVDGLPMLTREIGLPPHTLRRLSARYFGFAPKLLLLRARFLRSFTRMVAAGGDLDYSTMAASYYDASHFLRDAQAFLGTTPKRFIAGPTTFLRAILRARSYVLGAPTHALHAIRVEALDGPEAAP